MNIDPLIRSIQLESYGYIIEFSNMPNRIVRYYSEFSNFDNLQDVKDRRTVFLMISNLQHILHYSFIERIPDTKINNVDVNLLLAKCTFLTDNDREFIKLQLM